MRAARVLSLVSLIAIVTALPPGPRVGTASAAQDSTAPVFRADPDLPPTQGSIRGRVIESGSGRPIAGAEVSIVTWGNAGEGGVTRITDARGQFAVSRVAPGTYEVLVGAAHYVPGSFGQSGASRRPVPVEVRGGQAASGVDVELTPTSALSGRVLSTSGEGVAGVPVELIRRTYHDRGTGSRARGRHNPRATECSGSRTCRPGSTT